MPTSRAVTMAVVLWLVVAPALAPAAVGVAHPEASPTTGTAPTTGPGACPSTGASSDAAILAAYPNPVAAEDRGEFVVLDLPPGTTLTGWTLGDDETTALLPNRTVSGPVAVTTAPAAARPLTDHPVVAIEDSLSLSNVGESLTLACGGTVVDTLAYENAPPAELRTGAGWRPLGATSHRPAVVENATVRAFALPDAPEVPIETLRAADRRILLGGYTFASARAADALRDAAERGVRVRVLVEGGPVGGISSRQARILDDLARSPVEVRALTGPYARYAYHHPKYAVVDDRVLVTSENWKPSGTGGHGSRGWGVVVHSAAMAEAASTVFDRDADWRAATPWREFRANRTFQPATPANATFPARKPPLTLRAERVHLLVAPDNAEAGVLDLLRAANRSIAVEQVSVEPGSPFLRETVAAARRGVRVRVLLGGAWYVREENARLADRLNALAAEEGLPLEARLVSPRSGFEKIHVKGVVVDGERAVVGSLNWNNHSARENREVIVVLEGEAVAGYYQRLFRADWRGGSWRLPVGIVVTLVVAGTLALLVARRRVVFAEPPLGFDESPPCASESPDAFAEIPPGHSERDGRN